MKLDKYWFNVSNQDVFDKYVFIVGRLQVPVCPHEIL